MQIVKDKLHFLMVVLIVALSGCATSDRTAEQTPPFQVAESTWRQVDDEISVASHAAEEPAINYTRGFMESWRTRVRQRTESDFIPWFTSYWVQQWMAVKVGWYKLGAGEAAELPVNQLAAYLQEQYNDRVLAPVAREIDPDVLRTRATILYVQLLGEQVRGIQLRHGLPTDQFDMHLMAIPAITLAPPQANNASLYQIVHADPLTGLPAYQALNATIRNAAGRLGDESLETLISPAAKRVSEQVISRLAVSGGVSAASAVVGGVAGIAISLGAAGFGIVAHENARPEMEAQLRENLEAALDDLWHNLMEDRSTGVLAEVDYLSAQIEAVLAKNLAQPVEPAAVLHLRPLPDEHTHQGEGANERVPAELPQAAGQ